MGCGEVEILPTAVGCVFENIVGEKKNDSVCHVAGGVRLGNKRSALGGHYTTRMNNHPRITSKGLQEAKESL